MASKTMRHPARVTHPERGNQAGDQAFGRESSLMFAPLFLLAARQGGTQARDDASGRREHTRGW